MYSKRLFHVTARWLRCAVVMSVFLPIAAVAHDIEHTVTIEGAVVVHLYEDHGVPFAGEHVEVFGPGDTKPFLVGNTDGEGRIAFFPNREGEWRLKAYSEDGHGVDLTIDTRKLGSIQPSQSEANTSVDRRSTMVLGIGIILSIFGAGALLRKRAAG
jgi:nickel transport protein